MDPSTRFPELPPRDDCLRPVAQSTISANDCWNSPNDGQGAIGAKLSPTPEEDAMPDFLAQFLLRLCVMLPVILGLVATIWWVLRKRGVVKEGAVIDASDMRTWSLRFALADAAVFALIYALASAWMGEGDWSAGVAGGISAVVAIGVFPRLAARFA
jgi:hypothetical protein